MDSNDDDDDARRLIEHVNQSLVGPIGTLHLAAALLLRQRGLPPEERDAIRRLGEGAELVGGVLRAYGAAVGLSVRASGTFERLAAPITAPEPPMRSARRRKWSHR
jgi:hypothetical protein